MDSNIVHVRNLTSYVRNRVVSLPNGHCTVTLGLRHSSMNTIIVNPCTSLTRNVGIGYANHVLRIPINHNLLNHIIGALNTPVSNGNPLSRSNFSTMRTVTPNIVRHRSMSRPMRANCGTISSVVPVNHNRHRLVVNSHRANGATLTVSTVVGRHSSNVGYVCITVNRGTSAVSGIMHGLRRRNTLTGAVIIMTATSRSTTLRCLTPCTNYTVNRCFHSHNRSTLVVCSSLSGRTITCHRVSLLLHHPPKHRTFPNSIFCLRSHLLRHTTHIGTRCIRTFAGNRIGKGANSLATLPVVRARTNSISTFIPAGMVSVASNRVFLRAGLFGTNVHPTIGPNVSMSHINNTTRAGVVGGLSNNVHATLTRCHRLTTFSRFTSSLSSTAHGRLSRNRGIARLLGRGRCTPVSITRRSLILFTTRHNCLTSIRLSGVNDFRTTLLTCISHSRTPLVRRVGRANNCGSRVRNGLGNVLSSFGTARS